MTVTQEILGTATDPPAPATNTEATVPRITDLDFRSFSSMAEFERASINHLRGSLACIVCSGTDIRVKGGAGDFNTTGARTIQPVCSACRSTKGMNSILRFHKRLGELDYCEEARTHFTQKTLKKSTQRTLKLGKAPTTTTQILKITQKKQETENHKNNQEGQHPSADTPDSELISEMDTTTTPHQQSEPSTDRFKADPRYSIGTNLQISTTQSRQLDMKLGKTEESLKKAIDELATEKEKTRALMEQVETAKKETTESAEKIRNLEADLKKTMEELEKFRTPQLASDSVPLEEKPGEIVQMREKLADKEYWKKHWEERFREEETRRNTDEAKATETIESLRSSIRHHEREYHESEQHNTYLLNLVETCTCHVKKGLEKIDQEHMEWMEHGHHPADQVLERPGTPKPKKAKGKENKTTNQTTHTSKATTEQQLEVETWAQKTAKTIPEETEEQKRRRKWDAVGKKSIKSRSAPLGFSRIHFPIPNNLGFRKCHNMKDTRELLWAIIRNLGIRKYVVDLSSIGTTIMEAYIVADQQGKVVEKLKEHNIDLIRDLDMLAPPEWAPTMQMEERLIRRLGWKLHFTRLRNLQQCLLSGLPEHIVVAIVEFAKAPKTAAAQLNIVTIPRKSTKAPSFTSILKPQYQQTTSDPTSSSNPPRPTNSESPQIHDTTSNILLC